MAINKSEIISQFKASEKDTGSTPVQIALITRRITELTEHLSRHRKDHSTRRALLKLAGQRRRMLKYLLRINPGRYEEILKELQIRSIQ